MSFVTALKSIERKLKVLTTDILIWDRIAYLAESPELLELITKYNLHPDDKSSLTYEQMQEFKEAFDKIKAKGAPGGSASNTTRTMKKMLGDLVSVIFVGILGKDEYGAKIRAAFKETGIDIKDEIPKNKKNIKPETAVSFVIVFPDGKRTIATYPGNAKDIVTKDMFPENLIAEMDIIFLQGSVRKKFDPVIVDHILESRWRHAKQLVLALPTTAFQPDYFGWALPSANIILSNADELGFITGVDVKTATNQLEELERAHKIGNATAEQVRAANQARQILVEGAFSRLQGQLRAAAPMMQEKFPDQEQVAFITDGGNGAYIITADKIEHVPIHPRERVVNSLGAGDTSYAGFLIGKLLLNLNNKQAAQLAMALAAAKVQNEGPTLEDPIQALIEIAPGMGGNIQRRINALKVLSSPDLPTNGQGHP